MISPIRATDTATTPPFFPGNEPADSTNIGPQQPPSPPPSPAQPATDDVATPSSRRYRTYLPAEYGGLGGDHRYR